MLLCPSLPHNTGSQLRLTCKFCSLIYYIPSVQHNINVNINRAHINPLLVKIPVNTKLSYIFITSQSCEMISPWADFTWHCIGLTLALRLTNCQFCFVWLELQLSTRRVTETNTYRHLNTQEEEVEKYWEEVDKLRNTASQSESSSVLLTVEDQSHLQAQSPQTIYPSKNKEQGDRFAKMTDRALLLEE